jgi:acyl-CoA reductase-like NAD-dependent aldehyde dehydrogenase
MSWTDPGAAITHPTRGDLQGDAVVERGRPIDRVVELDALIHTGGYRSQNQLVVPDVRGTPVARLSLLPPLFIHRSMAALLRATTMPPDARRAALSRAGRAFSSTAIDGFSVDEYELAVSRTSGLPISAVRDTTQQLAQSLISADESAHNARPVAAVSRWSDPPAQGGRAVWTRRGDVFAVHAAGNHPAVHSIWLEALALGYRVAVRPSRREPITPHRLVVALREAGFGNDQVVLLPTDHAGAGDIIRGADLAMVYGGDEVVSKYGTDSTVLPQGPGRSKILVTGGDWREHLDTVVDSISHHGGTGCVNASVVYVDGDPTAVAEAIADRLSSLPSLPPEAEDAALPVQPLATARRLESFLLDRARGARALLGGSGIVDDLGDGSAVLRPAVFEVASSRAPDTGVELPFPCVWVAPWHPNDGVRPLRNSLVLTVFTRDERLIDQLVDEPTIRNVHIGDHPTTHMQSGLPHDGHLAEFLMGSKTVIR